MSDYTQEQFDKLPEEFQKDFVAVGEGDVKEYRHAGFAKVKQTADSLDQEAKELKNKIGEYQSKESEREQKKLADAKALEDKKLEDALKSNDGSAAEIFKQQLEDSKRLSGESEIQFKAKLDKIAEKMKSDTVKQLSNLAVKGGEKAFEKLISELFKVNPETGEELFFNEDGSASSFNRDQFIANLPNIEVLKPLLAGKLPSKSPAFLNGSQGEFTADLKRSKMSSDEKSSFIQEHGQKAYLALKK